MPRYARLHVPGGTFHVISRCLNREHLIDDDADRQHYLSLVGATLRRCDAGVLAWALMSTHVHLVVRAGDEPLERLMKPVNTGYAGWKNRRSGRLGPVFAGRFRSVLVEEDAYLLELVRYVHNNPVRAGMARSAADCDWTSHRAYLGFSSVPDWLPTADVLGLFGNDPQRARLAFDDFVNDGGNEARRSDFAGEAMEATRRDAAAVVGDAWRLSCPIVGSEEFAARVYSKLRVAEDAVEARASTGPRRRPELDELVAYVCAVLGLERWEFEQHPKKARAQVARMVLTWLWVRRFAGKQADVARMLKAPSARVSAWYGQAVRRRPELESLTDEVERRLPVDAPTVPWKTSRRVHTHLVIEDELGSKS